MLNIVVLVTFLVGIAGLTVIATWNKCVSLKPRNTNPQFTTVNILLFLLWLTEQLTKQPTIILVSKNVLSCFISCTVCWLVKRPVFIQTFRWLRILKRTNCYYLRKWIDNSVNSWAVRSVCGGKIWSYQNKWNIYNSVCNRMYNEALIRLQVS